MRPRWLPPIKWGRATLLVCWGILRPCIRGAGGQSCSSQLQKRVRQGSTRQKADAVSSVHVSHTQFHSLIHAWIGTLSWKNPVNFLLLLFLYRHLFYIKEKSWGYQGSEQRRWETFTIYSKLCFHEGWDFSKLWFCFALPCVVSKNLPLQTSTPFHSHFIIFASYEVYFHTYKHVRKTPKTCVL